MLKIGVLGAGHLGKIHLKCIREIPEFELSGFFDADPENAKAVGEEFGLKCFRDLDEMMDEVDVVDIVTPTVSHFESAARALKRFKHVFIEKPVVATPEEARKLLAIAEEAKVKVQVGHVERFNPAFVAAQPFIKEPMFIEAHRLAMFNPRGTDVPVVLDLMIHDIDIILNVVQAKVRKVSASGVSIISETPDIANARLEFDNGCVANLTASRISLKNMRKARFFQKDAYIAVDFLEKKSEIIRMKPIEGEPGPFSIVVEPPGGQAREIFIEKPDIEPSNAIRSELDSFRRAITDNTLPPVTISDGYQALDIAYQILEKVKF